jgi:hypothetical protein
VANELINHSVLPLLTQLPEHHPSKRARQL